MWWGIYAVTVIIVVCSVGWDVLSQRERDQRNRYYWALRDKLHKEKWG